MIARFQVLLPTAIDRPAPAEPVATDVIVDGYSVRIWSPMQTLMSAQDLDGRSEVPLFSAMQGIRPNPEPRVSTTVEIDGTPTVLSNLLVIDFMKPEFDRAPASEDPPLTLGLRIANEVVASVRYLLRSPNLRPLPTNSPTRIDYLNDDGSELEPAPPLARARVLGSFTMSINAVDNAAWTEALNLGPEFHSSGVGHAHARCLFPPAASTRTRSCGWARAFAFARLGRWRRLSRCYVGTEASARAWLEVACVAYLFARLRTEPT